MNALSPKTLLLGHSPDPDDAFMFYALAAGKIPTGPWRFEHVLQDIQTLNERVRRGELPVSAISIHAYPYVHETYALLNCGASMGEGYGPVVAAREPMTVDDLHGTEILVPGTMTTAFLVLQLLLGANSFRHRVVPFDEIIPRVADGQAQAGLIIHEGQLTYSQQRLHAVVDLGKWWSEKTQLPLPLGGNVIRRDLGRQNLSEIAALIHQSIEYGLSHRDEAVDYALRFARDMGRPLADRFVGMYVNHRTLDYGPQGRDAVRKLLHWGHQAGLIPQVNDIEFIGA